jgi:hypothetical protein
MEQKQPDNLEKETLLKTLFVFPNNKSGDVLLQKVANRFSNQPIILPDVISLDDLARKGSEKKEVQPYEAAVHLFYAYRLYTGSQEAFHSFLPLGMTILQDFEDIVKSNLDYKKIFHNLVKWGTTGNSFANPFSEEELQVLEKFTAHFTNQISETRARFWEFWTKIPDILETYVKTLQDHNLATKAQIFQDVLKNQSLNFLKNQYHEIHLTGFGLLNQIEIDLIRYLSNLLPCSYHWDIHPDLIQNPFSETNKILSLTKKRWPDFPFNPIETTLSKEVPNFHLIKCPGLTSIANFIQKKIRDENWGSETAIIAADPALFQTLTENATEGTFPFNMSMGFPLAYTGHARWLIKILNYCEQYGKPLNLQLEALINDPLSSLYFQPEEKNQILQLNKQPNTGNGNKFLESKKLDWLIESNIRRFLEKFIDWFDSHQPDPAKFPEREIHARFYLKKCLRELHQLAQNLEPESIHFQTLINLLPTLFQKFPIPVEGNNQEGVQVIGVFESRNLSFRRLVVAPANEGKLPSAINRSTFLPDGLRNIFGVHLRSEKSWEEIHLIYQLSLKSEEVFLLSDSTDTSRESRLIDQIRYSETYNHKKISLQYPSSIALPEPIWVTKNQVHSSFTETFLTRNQNEPPSKSFSPSSLYDLISCPLKFHFKKIEGLKEPDHEIPHTMNPLDFGNWIHTGIQHLYANTSGKNGWLSKSDFQKMGQYWMDIKEKIWDQLEHKKSPLPIKKFPIEMAIGDHMVIQFLEMMSNWPPHRWLNNEWNFSSQVFHSENFNWSLTGRADIILETENNFVILDLKTGSAKESNQLAAVKKGNPEFNENKLLASKDVFQMVLYSRLAAEDPFFAGKQNTRAHLVYMAGTPKNLKPEDPLSNISNQESVIAYFKNLDQFINGHLEKWADMGNPIGQTSNMGTCRFCGFNVICQRAEAT